VYFSLPYHHIFIATGVDLRLDCSRCIGYPKLRDKAHVFGANLGYRRHSNVVKGWLSHNDCLAIPRTVAHAQPNQARPAAIARLVWLTVRKTHGRGGGRPGRRAGPQGHALLASTSEGSPLLAVRLPCKRAAMPPAPGVGDAPGATGEAGEGASPAKAAGPASRRWVGMRGNRQLSCVKYQSLLHRAT
jgi:hypothetical protein